MSDAPTLLHDEMCESISVDIGVGEMHSPCGCDARRLERRCAELEAGLADSITLLDGWITRYCNPRYRKEHMDDLAKKRALLGDKHGS